MLLFEQVDVNARELAALMAVIGCVKEFSLEGSYTLDPLQRRLEQLERVKPDKERGDRGDEVQIGSIINSPRNQSLRAEVDPTSSKAHRAVNLGQVWFHQHLPRGQLIGGGIPTLLVIRSRGSLHMLGKRMIGEHTPILMVAPFRPLCTILLEHSAMELTM